MFADIRTSAGAPFVICVPSVVELPNEYVLPESICGRTVVMDDPAKTTIPAVARCDLAEAPRRGERRAKDDDCDATR